MLICGRALGPLRVMQRARGDSVSSRPQVMALLVGELEGQDSNGVRAKALTWQIRSTLLSRPANRLAGLRTAKA